MTLKITSTAFTEGALIPAKFSCDGEDISPRLQWDGAPAGTKSFALIMDDPDAPMGTWDHWLLFNIPAATVDLAENVSLLPAGTIVGKNSWGRLGWGGPCPPDREHRYFFKLFALDTVLDLPKGSRKAQIESAMKGHILAEARLMGRYDRKR